MEVDLIGGYSLIPWFSACVILLLGGHLAKSGDIKREYGVGILGVEARGAAKHPTLTRHPPQQRIIHPHMSAVTKSRSPALSN